jgi:hypothetical protein
MFYLTHSRNHGDNDPVSTRTYTLETQTIMPGLANMQPSIKVFATLLHLNGFNHATEQTTYNTNTVHNVVTLFTEKPL